MRSLILYIAMALIVSGCEPYQLDDCFSSAGDVKSEHRELASFDRVQVGQKFDVQLIQDTTKPESIEITCGSNLLEGIESKVKDGMLEVRNRNTCNFVRSFKDRIQLVINVHDVREMTISGDVFVHSTDTLFLENLHIYQSGLNDIDLILNVKERVLVNSINSGLTILHGRSRKLEGSIEEVSDLDARNLVCEEVLIDSHTPLDCYINATRLIFVKIFNRGNIFYMQEPSGLKELNVKEGSGELLKFE